MLSNFECPYCGEPFELVVDDSAGNQDYIEDCPVCCRPIEVHLETDIASDAIIITLKRDDD